LSANMTTYRISVIRSPEKSLDCSMYFPEMFQWFQKG
jgi:hypothetical protein